MRLNTGTRRTRPKPSEDELEGRLARVTQHPYRAFPRRHRRRRRARLRGARKRKRTAVQVGRRSRRSRQLGAAAEPAKGVGGDGGGRRGAAVRREPPQQPHARPHLAPELLRHARDEPGEVRQRRLGIRGGVHLEVAVRVRRAKRRASLLRERELRGDERGAHGAKRSFHPRRRRSRRGRLQATELRKAAGVIICVGSPERSVTLGAFVR